MPYVRLAFQLTHQPHLSVISVTQPMQEKEHAGPPQRDTSRRSRPDVKRHGLRGTQSLPTQRPRRMEPRADRARCPRRRTGVGRMGLQNPCGFRAVDDPHRRRAVSGPALRGEGHRPDREPAVPGMVRSRPTARPGGPTPRPPDSRRPRRRPRHSRRAARLLPGHPVAPRGRAHALPPCPPPTRRAGMGGHGRSPRRTSAVAPVRGDSARPGLQCVGRDPERRRLRRAPDPQARHFARLAIPHRCAPATHACPAWRAGESVRAGPRTVGVHGPGARVGCHRPPG